MPRVLMALLQSGEERAQRAQEALRVLARDVVSGVDLGDAQPGVGGAHLFLRLRGVHVRARTAQREDRAAHLADELPHVHAELRALAALEHLPELVAKMRIALHREALRRLFQIRLETLAAAFPEVFQ